MDKYKEFFRQLGLPRHEAYEWAKRSMELSTFDIDFYRNRRHALRTNRIGQENVDKQIFGEIKQEYRKAAKTGARLDGCGSRRSKSLERPRRSISEHSRSDRSRSPRHRSKNWISVDRTSPPPLIYNENCQELNDIKHQQIRNESPIRMMRARSLSRSHSPQHRFHRVQDHGYDSRLPDIRGHFDQAECFQDSWNNFRRTQPENPTWEMMLPVNEEKNQPQPKHLIELEEFREHRGGIHRFKQYPTSLAISRNFKGRHDLLADSGNSQDIITFSENRVSINSEYQRFMEQIDDAKFDDKRCSLDIAKQRHSQNNHELFQHPQRSFHEPNFKREDLNQQNISKTKQEMKNHVQHFGHKTESSDAPGCLTCFQNNWAKSDNKHFNPGFSRKPAILERGFSNLNPGNRFSSYSQTEQSQTKHGEPQFMQTNSQHDSKFQTTESNFSTSTQNDSLFNQPISNAERRFRSQLFNQRIEKDFKPDLPNQLLNKTFSQRANLITLVSSKTKQVSILDGVECLPINTKNGTQFLKQLLHKEDLSYKQFLQRIQAKNKQQNKIPPMNVMKKSSFWIEWWKDNGWVESLILKVEDKDPNLLQKLNFRTGILKRATEKQSFTLIILKACEKVFLNSLNNSDDEHIEDAYGFLRCKAILHQVYGRKPLYEISKPTRKQGANLERLVNKVQMMRYYMSIIDIWKSVHACTKDDFSRDKLEANQLLKEYLFNWLAGLAFAEIKRFSTPIFNPKPKEEQLKSLFDTVSKLTSNHSEIRRIFFFNDSYANPINAVNERMNICKHYLNGKPYLNFDAVRAFLIARIQLTDTAWNDHLDADLRQEKDKLLLKLETSRSVDLTYERFLSKYIQTKDRLEYVKSIHPSLKLFKDGKGQEVFHQFVHRMDLRYICKFVLLERIKKYGTFEDPTIHGKNFYEITFDEKFNFEEINANNYEDMEHEHGKLDENDLDENGDKSKNENDNDEMSTSEQKNFIII